MEGAKHEGALATHNEGRSVGDGKGMLNKNCRRTSQVNINTKKYTEGTENVDGRPIA